MDFTGAIRTVAKGGRVRRPIWDDKGIFVSMHEKILCLYKPEDKLYHPWTITESDIEAKDWEPISAVTVAPARSPLPKEVKTIEIPVRAVGGVPEEVLRKANVLDLQKAPEAPLPEEDEST